MEEVRANGFGSDLCLSCGVNDECKHGEDHSILRVVDEKMNDHRHKAMNKPLNRAQMLSLILYTGCECNYDLCSSQRDGDYDKWKWFDYCLYWAIAALSNRERGYFSVYSGLNNVQLATKSVKCGYFKTYVSTAWKKDVAQAFMGKDLGMIVNIDKAFKNGGNVWCCDVSWISKFPDECEVLFARGLDIFDKFECVVLDDANGVQTVSLKKT